MAFNDTKSTGDSVTADEWNTMVDNLSVKNASYIIFKDGSTVKALNGSTGSIDYSSSNASAVIQYAINHLTSGRTWKERVVLKGNFTIDSTILLDSYIILEGGHITIADDTNINILENKDKDTGNTDIDVINVELDGNRNAQTSISEGIHFENVSKIKICDATIKNTRGDGIYIKNCDIIKIIDNKFLDNREATLADSMRLDNCSDIVIRGNYIDNPAFHCISLAQLVNNAIIEGNILKNAGWHGIITFAQGNASYKCRYITIANNEIYGCGKTGVYLDQYVEFASVTGNLIRDVSEHGIFCDIGAEKCIISSNNVYNVGLTGIYAGIGLSEEIIVSSNIVDSPGDNGIRVYAASYGDIENIIITNNIIRNIPLIGSKKGIVISDDGTYRYENVILTRNIVDTAPYGIVIYTSNTGNPPGWVNIDDNILRNCTTNLSIHPSVTLLKKSGTATITPGSSSVVVNHNLASTPTYIDVEPAGDIGYTWVSNVNSTSFTIHCSSAPSSDTTVYWSAKYKL